MCNIPQKRQEATTCYFEQTAIILSKNHIDYLYFFSMNNRFRSNLILQINGTYKRKAGLSGTQLYTAISERHIVTLAKGN